MRITDLVTFIRLREGARVAKEEGFKYKADPIIAKYRFCNVRRNDDRVTKFIFSWAKAWDGSPEQWFAFVVARLFNNEDTLAAIAPYVIPFKPDRMERTLHLRAEKRLKNFNAAYIVSTNGQAMDKATYVVRELLAPMWALRQNITMSLRGATLSEAHDLFMRQRGLGSFMAAQVLADLKYVKPELWEDFDSFCASGPGSKRGLNRVLGRDYGKGMTETQFRFHMLPLRKAVNERIAKTIGALTAQDLQNCLCEFDKYERARVGDGVPKQIYTPKED